MIYKKEPFELILCEEKKNQESRIKNPDTVEILCLIPTSAIKLIYDCYILLYFKRIKEYKLT